VGTTNPFAQREREAGATFVERCGVEMPKHYGDPLVEYEAARVGVGLVDFSFRGLLRLTGRERLRWLNGQITNDVKTLKPGEGLLAAVLNAKGHLLSDLAAFGLDDSVWIDLPRDRVPVIREAFERHIIADDVQVDVMSEHVGHLTLVGPEARSVLAGVVGVEAVDLSPWRHAEGRLGDAPIRVVASRWLARPSFDLFVPADATGRVWDALLSRGQGAGMRPVGLTALEWLRVEAGWPWFGVDFDESNLLMEALTPDYASFTKGCYVGQEVVTRVEHQGHLNKKLCGLAFDGTTIPARGDLISLGDRKVGQVTSAVRSPALGRVIALASLRRECWEAGTRVRVASAGTTIEASVASFPFVSDDPTEPVSPAR
jgi:folate-binding protein YgfZ